MNSRVSPLRAKHLAALQIAGGAIGYLLLLTLRDHWLQGTPAGATRAELSVLPALPVLWMLWSIHRYLTRADELQRRVHIEALGIAAGVTAAFSIVYALLEESAGFPHLSARWAILLVGMTWVMSGFVLWRRYK